MAITSGFYSSKDGDRKYSALDFGRMFDGLIHDGIFATALNGFRPRMKANTGLTITVDSGRAWFNHTWVHNDDVMEIDAHPAHPTLLRWDALCITVDRSDDQRRAYLEIVEGTPSAVPQRPNFAGQDKVQKRRYPIFHLLMDNNVGEGTTPRQVSDNRGQAECPFVTGIIDHLDGEALFKRWDESYNKWAADLRNEIQNDLTQWKSEKESDYSIWKDTLVKTLDGDAATRLAQQIAEVKTQLAAMTAGFKVFWDLETADGRVLEDKVSAIQIKIVYAPKTE